MRVENLWYINSYQNYIIVYARMFLLIIHLHNLKVLFLFLMTISVYRAIWRKCSRQTLFLGEIMSMCVCRYVRKDGYIYLSLSIYLSHSLTCIFLSQNRQNTYGENATSLFIIEDCCLCCIWVHFLIMRCAATQFHGQCLDVQPDAKTMHWMCKLMHAGWTFCS